MRRTALGWMGICLAAVCLQAEALQAANLDSAPVSAQRAALNRYCVTCHNEKLKTAGLMLDQMDVQKVAESAPVWEKVVRKLRTRAMPPAGAPRPDESTYDALAIYIETALDSAAAAKPDPGRPAAVHRLNRSEYTNSIRDLLGTDFHVESLLPPDDSGYGFDNIGDVLSVSPLLLEKYISAAGKVSHLAVGGAIARPDVATYELPRFLLQDDRMNEDLPFGSRGGAAIRHFFPVDGEYVIKIRLPRSALGYDILGISRPHHLELRLDRARIKLFAVGGKKKEEPPPVASANPGNRQETTYQSKEEQQADANLEVRIPVKAGTRLIGVTFPRETLEQEEVIQPRLEDRQGDNPAVGSVIVEGPFDASGPGDTPSRRRIFVCRPSSTQEEQPCASNILTTLARRAYRRPASDGDVQPLLQLFKAGRDSAPSPQAFEAGIEMALKGMLVSPKFLVRIEHDPRVAASHTAYRITDLELASRLSFFLWSSIPDDPLLDLAERGKLHEPAVLDQQVRRMLADSRSQALTDNFAGQWLYLRNVRSITPDSAEYPEFDENLREALQKETELFFESMLRENRGVLDLLSANYTYLNERLARHYGIPNIYGSHFRRVTVSDENRKGLLGQGSLLMVTSYANRTSPTLRGKWLLANVLGAPPPPPPPNVPSLQDRGADGKILSVRQQMEAHRANPVCASCHARMDPLGFALENFDAVGKWRDTSGAAHTPIDASGVLPDGTKFQGPAELRKILISKPDQFAVTVTERLLVYALGRGIDYYDEPAVRKIMREAAPGGYRWSSLISGIVKSTPFQMRRSGEP